MAFVRKFKDGIGPMPECTVMDIEKMEQWTEHIAMINSYQEESPVVNLY